ncbi:MAG TPA: hypothetical protein VGZ47_18370, partial [Gemmataceae bacterium]|nr:hypothetical protein [Gemmataceae bacterium]
AGENCYRLKGPLVDETFIRIRLENGKWFAAIANSADGPPVRQTEPNFASETDAWNAAFELYRAEKVY